MNFVDTVNVIDAVKNDYFAVVGFFLHGVNFTGEEVGKFVGVSTALKSRFIVGFVGSVKQGHGDGGDLLFVSGVLVKNRRSDKLPNFRNVFSFDDFLPVNSASDSDGAFSNPAEFEKSPAVYRLQFFIELAFGFERALCEIRIEVSPDIRFFGVVGDNGDEEVANVKHTFNDFETIRIIKFGVGILSYDAPESCVAENIVTGNHKSNDGIVESAVEVGEIGTGDNVFISENLVVVKPNDTPEVFRFVNCYDGSVFVALNSVVPSHIAHLVFWRKISDWGNESGAFEKRFCVGVVKH